MPTTWASGAKPSYIRTIGNPSLVGKNDGAASYTDGFPPLNFTPVAAGGVPPYGADMNGILKQMTAMGAMGAGWWADPLRCDIPERDRRLPGRGARRF